MLQMRIKGERIRVNYVKFLREDSCVPLCAHIIAP
jgi:hypothetical protein